MNNYELRLIPKEDCDGNTYWTAFFPDVNGVVGGGNTPEEAITEAQDNLKFYLEHLKSKDVSELGIDGTNNINYIEKDQRIAELEKEVEELKKQDIEHLYDKELLIRVAKDSNNNAKLTYKALELACDVLRDINYYTFDEKDVDFEKHFIKEAEKELGDK